MLFGAINREECFFGGSLSPICMKTAAQLLDHWEIADYDNWTKAYGVPWEIMVRYLRYWSLVSDTGSLMLVRQHDGPFPKCFKVTCEYEPQRICKIVYVLDDEKEDDRILIVQMRNLSLLAIRLFGDDEKLVAEALPFDASVPDDSVPTVAEPASTSGTFDASVPDDSVPTVAEPASTSGTGTAKAPSRSTSTSSRWPSTSSGWPPQWTWTPLGWCRNW